jgi:hypothetical protein
MDEGSQADIEEMAELLKIRKNSHHPTVLLLGARAGRLFRSERFYEDLQFFSNVNFHGLPRIKQFKECYTILTSGKFSEWDLYSILQAPLKDVGAIPADICLASLIKHRYFAEIISTNIDDVLEEALDQTDMRQGRDYEVMRIGSDATHYESSHSCRVVKPFGDLVSREYTIKGRASRLEQAKARTFLQGLLAKDLLIVGIDPTWDRDILRFIPAESKGAIWFASEQEDIAQESSFLAENLSARCNKAVLGYEGSYSSFISKIHNYLHGSKLTDHLTTELHTMMEQLIRLAAAQSALDDQLQALHNDCQTFFSETLREIQKIQKKLEEMEKHQNDS